MPKWVRTMKRILPRLVLITGLLLTGCDATSTAPEPEVVVEAYLVAGEALAPVRLTRSVDASTAFSITGAAVRDAAVRIERLGEDGAATDRYTYAPDADEPGLYRPIDTSILVAPAATYRLIADVPGEGMITATTRVPSSIAIVRADNERTAFQSNNQPSLTITRSGSSDRQDRYVFTVTSLLDFETTSEGELAAQLTPFYADAWDADDESISELRVNASPVLNEANYDINPDNTITIDLPWIAVAFFGPNRTAINVIDDNYYDFLRSRQAQQSGTPGEIPNVLDRVEGGTGLFASYARVSLDIDVLRP